MKKFALILTLIGTALAVTPQSQTALPTVRVAPGDFTYLGAFRLPGQNGTATTQNPDMRGEINTFHGGGEALAMSLDGQGIFLTGSRCCNDPSDAGPTTVAEISIPEIRRTATIDGLATAAYRQPHRDVLNSTQRQVGCGGPIGGLLVFGGNLLANVYCYYDGGYVQNRSLFQRTGLNMTAGVVSGPMEVQSPATGGGRAGFVSGYMGHIPAEWQAALGGDVLIGNCCIPIITRTSWGPAVSVLRGADIGRISPVPATSVVGYPTEHPLDGGAGCDSTSNLFHCNTSVAAVVMVPGTDSTLFFGTHGTGDNCYGPGTTNPAQHRQPDGEGGHYCYDPTGGSKGAHAYPYHHYVWAYATSDLVRVKNGQMQNWQVRPYAVWGYETPFQIGRRGVSGATFDPTTRRLYISIGEQDRTNDIGKPLIHVYQIGQGGSTPPPPPPPPTATDAVVSAWSAWSGGNWSACSNGTQSRTETRTRTVVTPATNGGTTPQLSETRTASQSCTVTPPPVDPPPTVVTLNDIKALIEKVLAGQVPPPTLVGCTVSSTTTNTITLNRSSCGLVRPSTGAILRVVKD